ncbi:uncharacterized protein DUF3261 [Chromohalobacter marismortui]|uniref:Uncharacterized protein DUF3261 n=1 Tax=Chromohalobacter marismortui TaxID=42055 RepID=A0A4R7NM00_9GAMM|nr:MULTISPECIES: DUF3261 domain-containing protein [Chromohalobacter]MCI0510239.1 DUF3261 domain-containing protein [Chromohalobacter sp.]MCI0593415.1 DUF3261 domain-containing protein [Chromohalobacter sp.]TDU21657.1 uncharacterized protein DUF3261 [Chromohalobacter marismortui]
MNLTRHPLALALCGLMLLGGCSLVPPIAPHPALDHAARSATLTRRLTFIPNDAEADTQTLIAVLRLAPDELRVVLTTPYGQRLTTLVRDASGSRFEQGDAPRRDALPFPPDWLATRLEWSLWPRAALEDAFADSEWTLDEDRQRRLITYRGEPVARIAPPPAQRDMNGAATVVLEDFQGDYRLRIAPLDSSTDHEASR